MAENNNSNYEAGVSSNQRILRHRNANRPGAVTCKAPVIRRPRFQELHPWERRCAQLILFFLI